MAPTLVSLGHGSIRQNGRLAAGGRPLLIVLGEYRNHPPFSAMHAPDYYEQLGFGSPEAPFSTGNPVNPASLRDYFRETSNGRFWFERVAVVGPVDLGVYENDPGPEERTARILARVAEFAPRLLAAADADLDRLVEFDELCVLLFENVTGLMPANRDNNPVRIRIDLGPFVWDGVVRIHIACAGSLTPFYQIAHELSHSLGTLDMYNAGAGNHLMTLMGAYPFWSDDQVSVHLDIWHKMALGWAEPRILDMGSHDAAVVREGADGAIVLWDASRDESEYFMVERRRPDAPGQRYDVNFPGDGVLVWRVQQGVVNGVAALGAPGLTPGGSGVWEAGMQTPVLSWANGDSTGIALTVAATGDGGLRVGWGEAVTQPSRSRHLRLFHGGNGTTAVDGGLPRTGVFYGVTSEGNLDWNRYNGLGEQIGDPASPQGWHANTGNSIGRGWAGALHVLGCGDGVILAVHPDGNLHWYCYEGSGKPDVTASTGWHPNSGNIIGRGWQGLQRIFVKARAGRPASRVVLFAVAQNGDLLWFSYDGNGERDPTGGTGWHPNSGNPIGRGWDNLRHVHGSGNVVFVVAQNGDLLWYSYNGNGERDPTGTLGWDRRSGNPIGRGWHGARHIFGGMTDSDGPAHILFAVQPNGDLRWYRYTGQGEADITGTIGWAPRSGNKIGPGW